MTKSSFIFSLILLTICGMFSSCIREEVYFNFKFKCSEELLDFVVPTAIYLDEKGIEQVTILDKSLFEKSEIKTTLNNSDRQQIICKWEKQIVIPGKSAERDMRIVYSLREENPQIDRVKDYYIMHNLDSDAWYSMDSDVKIITNATITVNGTDVNYISGSRLREYLDNLIKTPDYKIEVISGH